MTAPRPTPPSGHDRFADIGGTLVGAAALCILVLWYVAHLLG